MECGRVLIDLAACGRGFEELLDVDCVYVVLHYQREGGGFEVPLVVLLRVDCILS